MTEIDRHASAFSQACLRAYHRGELSAELACLSICVAEAIRSWPKIRNLPLVAAGTRKSVREFCRLYEEENARRATLGAG